jgi:four helix bundle protein
MMDFGSGVYKSTLLRDGIYSLAAQLKRTVIAIRASIADGQARFSPHDFFAFLGHTRGALLEVETQLILSPKLGHIPSADAAQFLDKAAALGKILDGLIGAIRPALQLRIEKLELRTWN